MRRDRGFSLIEALVALSLLLAGLAGAALLLLQTLRDERESATGRTALRLAASLAEELRARRPGGGEPGAAFVEAWRAELAAAMPPGTDARLRTEVAAPPRYRIEIDWPTGAEARRTLAISVTP